MSEPKTFLWSGQLKGEEIDKTKEKFNKWFKNDVMIISLNHRDPFDKFVEIIVKANTRGMNNFYSFDPETNKYVPFLPQRKWEDADGYTHFVTNVGGDIVISRGPLTPRKGI